MTIRKLLSHWSAATAIFCSCAGLLAPSAQAQPSVSWRYNFVTLDHPGIMSFPLGINGKGDVAGYYVDPQGILHGYLHKSAKFTTIDYPGAPQVPGGGSGAGGINDRGDITGVYFDAHGFQHGYIRTLPEDCDQEDGAGCKPVFHSIDVPGAAQTQGIPFEFGPGLGTAAIGLNNRRQVTGLYATTGLYSLGFVFSDGDDFRSVDEPASQHTPGLGTKLFGINDFGVIVGDYLTQAAPTVLPTTHGFVLDGHEFIPVMVPGSELGGFGTQANGINIYKEVVGVFSDRTGNGHGLFWVGGMPFILDFPGALFSEAHAINIHGVITGAYSTDPIGHTTHGFVAYPKDSDR